MFLTSFHNTPDKSVNCNYTETLVLTVNQNLKYELIRLCHSYLFSKHK